MLKKPIVIRLADGQVISFDKTQVAEATKFYLNNGNAIEVDSVDITEIVSELKSELQ